MGSCYSTCGYIPFYSQALLSQAPKATEDQQQVKALKYSLLQGDAAEVLLIAEECKLLECSLELEISLFSWAFIELVRGKKYREAMMLGRKRLRGYTSYSLEMSGESADQGPASLNVGEVVGLLCYSCPEGSELGFLLDRDFSKALIEFIFRQLQLSYRA